LYCAGDVLACHLAQAMEQGLNLQVGWGALHGWAGAPHSPACMCTSCILL
jgi:hypothetical protein